VWKVDAVNDTIRFKYESDDWNDENLYVFQLDSKRQVTGETYVLEYDLSYADDEGKLQEEKHYCIKNLLAGMLSGISTLSEVQLPKQLEYIDKEAFSGCSSLAEVTLPATTEEVAGGAFDGSAVSDIPITSCTTLSTNSPSSTRYTSTIRNLREAPYRWTMRPSYTGTLKKAS